MERNLELKVKSNQSTELKSLYKWCLNEYDSNDKKVDGDYIPWAWSCYFTSGELKVVRHIELNRYDENYELADKPRSEYKATIFADLHSGRPDKTSFWDRVSYSMFGTNRVIEKFHLSIHKASDQSELQGCRVYGIPSYDSEDSEFRKTTEDDFFGIDLYIKEDEFNEILEAIESKKASSALIRISGVSGFYSYWSPTINTSQIKILTSYHTVENEEGSSISPTHVATVDEFSMSLSTNEPNQDEEYTEIIDNAPEKTVAVDVASISRGIDSMRVITNSLKYPLWLIFIALLIIIFK
jgi:hypothetical protein